VSEEHLTSETLFGIELTFEAGASDTEFDPETVGGLGARRVVEHGFGGEAIDVVAFMGGIAALLSTLEWIRMRLQRQVVVDLRGKKNVKVEVQNVRNGRVIVIAPDGSVTHLDAGGPEVAKAIESLLRR